MRILVLGSGDVVRHRLLPALLSTCAGGELPIRELTSIRLISADPAPPPLPTHATLDVSWGSLTSIARGNELKSADAVIVATPSFVHVPYLRQVAAAGLLMAMEKPLTCLPHELPMVEELAHSGAFGRVFCLSYYVLEKALPLLCLFEQRSKRRTFLPFITFESAGGEPLSNDDLIALDVTQVSGRLRHIRVVLQEGPTGEGRAWSDLRQHGGQLLETFLHAALMADRIAGPCTSWDGAWKHRWHPTRPEAGPVWSSFRGRNGSVSLQLDAGKYLPDAQCRREAELVFEHGRILCDFGQRSLTLESPSLSLRGGIRAGWSNYQIQMRLFERFLAAGGMAAVPRYDGFDGQIRVLQWLMQALEPHA